MSIDLLIIGVAAAVPAWSAGEVVGGARTPAELRALLTAWCARTTADGIVFWDPSLGPPDPVVAASLLAGRGDVWHAGLKLGTRGKPGLVDFVAPTWMLAADAPASIESTSWRVSLGACVARTAVLRQLGLPCDDFDTLAGTALEWGHRLLARGALVRFVPSLVTMPPREIATPTLDDEVRLIAYRFGHSWANWACMRASLAGYAPVGGLLNSRLRVPSRRPYAEPEPYASHRVLDVPDLSRARVSVLIPTLNRYPYLHIVLENLRAQTVRPLEIIIVDQTEPARRDPTVATKFADLPLRWFYRDEPGQCASRNAGLQVAQGDYVLFLDDDDEVPPTVVEQHLRNLHAYGAEVSSGVVQEVGARPLDPSRMFVRTSDVFPTGNSMILRETLRQSGLFDLAFNRAPRADGELGMRLYLSGALMILDQGLSMIHHRAAEGGLRTYGARATTYRSSREALLQRHLPHVSEIYLAARHFSPRQRTEMLWLRTFETLRGHGSVSRQLAKAVIGGVLLPDTIHKTLARQQQAREWLARFPQIEDLSSLSDAGA